MNDEIAIGFEDNIVNLTFKSFFDITHSNSSQKLHKKKQKFYEMLFL